jgi:hypothetical protein
VYDDEVVSVTDAEGNAVEVTPVFDEADSLLRITPSAPLAPGPHQVEWPGLRGVAGSVGRGSRVDFTVSSAVDSEAPRFAGLTAIDWDLSRERDVCTDKLDDRFVFRLRVGKASDDAGARLLSLLVFETREPGQKPLAEPKRVALAAYPADGFLEVRRPVDDAGQTCFAAVAQDLLGNVSGGGERQVCVKTKQPPFFEGCALTVAPTSNVALAYLAAILALGYLRRGRNARTQPRRLA